MKPSHQGSQQQHPIIVIINITTITVSFHNIALLGISVMRDLRCLACAKAANQNRAWVLPGLVHGFEAFFFLALELAGLQMTGEESELRIEGLKSITSKNRIDGLRLKGSELSCPLKPRR